MWCYCTGFDDTCPTGCSHVALHQCDGHTSAINETRCGYDCDHQFDIVKCFIAPEQPENKEKTGNCLQQTHGGSEAETQICPACKGLGNVEHLLYKTTCGFCGGTGKRHHAETLCKIAGRKLIRALKQEWHK